MRILLFSLYFSPDVGANAVIMTELVEELIAYGHKLTVVTAFPHYADNVISKEYRGKIVQREAQESLTIFRTYLYSSPQKASFWVRFLNYVSFNILSTLVGIFSGPQDLILAPSPPLTIGFTAFIVGKLKRIPYIYNVQDINPDVLIKLGILKNPVGIAFSRWLELFVYRHATQISVLSESFRENLKRKGVPDKKITIIPNFIDVEFVRPLPRDNRFRQQFNIEKSFVVLYAGNLGHSQDLEPLLVAADMIQANGQKDIRIVIVGNGSREGVLKAKVGDMNLRNVLFLPFQPREYVPYIFAAADISLILLKQGIANNSIPSKVYTIMASARPAIAAVDEGSDTWKLIQKNRCGLCVRPNDPKALYGAILKLYQDFDLRYEYGENGRENVMAMYDRRIIGEQYHHLVERIGGKLQ